MLRQSIQMERLHEAKKSKQKKDKKRSNEKKARELLKLQLNMAAPADLDNDDQALAGEDDVFDLAEGEKEASRKGVSGVHDNMDEDGMSDEEDQPEGDGHDDQSEIADSDEEREAKLQGLEGELDGLYDEYKERMAERDTKWKVKQARAKDRNYDAWHGIQEDGSDSDDARVKRLKIRGRNEADEEEEEESDEGGWDGVAAKKVELDGVDDSSDDDDDDDMGRKTKRGSQRVRIDQRQQRPLTSRSLVTSLREGEERAQLSRQAQLWFDQPMFKDMVDLAALDEPDEQGSNGDDEDDGEDEDTNVYDDVEMQTESAIEDEVSRGKAFHKHALMCYRPMTSRLSRTTNPTTGRIGTSTMRTRTNSSDRLYRVSKRIDTYHISLAHAIR